MKKFLFAIICVMGLFSCEEYGSTDDIIVSKIPLNEGDAPVVKTLSVDLTSLGFEAGGGTLSFTITSNTSWTISKPEWCALSQTSGTGNAVISVTANENPNTEQRSGEVTVAGEYVKSVSIAVTQKAKEKEEEESHEPGAGDNLPPT